MSNPVHLVLIGDSGVGKSTLATWLYTGGSFDSSRVERVLPEVNYIPDFFPKDHGVVVKVIDTPCSFPDAASQSTTERALTSSDVVCVLYDVTNQASFESITSRWLPLLNRLRLTVPVVLVGNKMDARTSGGPNQTLQADVHPIMMQFKVVESCLECSALNGHNVSEVLFYSTNAVLYPTSPLFDDEQHRLRDTCLRALTYVFRQCDSDGDGFLNDDELGVFQSVCFGVDLTANELEQVKKVVTDGVGAAGLTDRGVTLEGFLFLQTLLIEKGGRQDVVWTMLRTFGFNDQLEQDSVVRLGRELAPRGSQSAELSEHGLDLFSRLFAAADADGDGLLSQQERDVYCAASGQSPWGDTGLDAVQLDAAGDMPLSSFLAFWQLQTSMSPADTLHNLFTHGCSVDDLAKAVVLTSPGAANRNAIHGFLFGPPASGKTALLRHLAAKIPPHIHQRTPAPIAAAAMIESTPSQHHCLILHEFGPFEHEVMSTGGPDGRAAALEASESGEPATATLAQCDLAVFCYDVTDAHSFRDAVARQSELSQHEPSIPVVFLACKSDMPPVTQLGVSAPDAYSKSLDLAPPLPVTRTGVGSLFKILTQTALNPEVALPKQQQAISPPINLIVGVTVAVVAAGLMMVMIIRRR